MAFYQSPCWICNHDHVGIYTTCTLDLVYYFLVMLPLTSLTLLQSLQDLNRCHGQLHIEETKHWEEDLVDFRQAFVQLLSYTAQKFCKRSFGGHLGEYQFIVLRGSTQVLPHASYIGTVCATVKGSVF